MGGQDDAGRSGEEPGRGFWERHATGYDRSMWLVGGPMPRTVQLVVAEVRGAGRVLEIASGTGLVTEAIAPVVTELLATDYADAMVEKTRARVGHLANVRCDRRSVYELGEPEASFDAVVSANVLHLVPDLTGALAAMRAVLRPGGLLVVPTFCHGENAVARAFSMALSVVSFPSQRRLDLTALVAAVEAAGFTVHARESVPGILPVGFVAARRPA